MLQRPVRPGAEYASAVGGEVQVQHCLFAHGKALQHALSSQIPHAKQSVFGQRGRFGAIGAQLQDADGGWMFQRRLGRALCGVPNTYGAVGPGGKQSSAVGRDDQATNGAGLTRIACRGRARVRLPRAYRSVVAAGH